MLIEAGLPEGHPLRVAAISRHAQDALSPEPIRQTRGQANLRKLNLSPTERLTITHPVAPQQTAPAQAAGLTPMPSPVHADMGGVTKAVDSFANAQIAKLSKQFSGGGFGGNSPLPPQAESALGLHIVAEAHQFLGTPYLWGGTTPKGFDCSGFAQYLYAKIGINIPRTSETQWESGRPVGKNGLQPGDLVFFKGSDSVGGLPGHVGVYIGHGMMIDAPHTGSHVRVESVHNFGGYMGARRYGKG